jgi:hypothetical protein
MSEDYRTRAVQACMEAAALFVQGKDDDARHQLMKAVYASDQLKERAKKIRTKAEREAPPREQP